MVFAIALVLLAQASGGWIKFEVCQIDLGTVPPTLARARDHSVFHTRAGTIAGVGKIRKDSQGLACAEIYTEFGRSVYVIGSPEEIMRRIDRKR